MATEQSIAFEALRDAARQGEPDRYLAALLAAEPQRSALLAVAAFSAELRRVPAQVTDPGIGEIRLQWWRDAIEGFGSGAKSGHPVADSLGQAVATFHLPPALLLAMTEARAFDLYYDPLPDDASFDGYLSKTEGVPFELAFRILAGRAPDAMERAALHDVTRAYGIARLAGDLPHHMARGHCPLSDVAIAQAGMTREQLLTGAQSSAATVLIQHLVRDASATHVAARSQLTVWPQMLRIAVLPLAAVPAYLKASSNMRRDPLREPVEIAPLTRIWRIAAGHYARRL
jgi:15-cis-phytoene synthase